MNAPALGSFPPNVRPAPRDRLVIADELRDAAERLALLAVRIARDASESAVTDLAALGTGVCRLACELRAGRGTP